MSNRHLCLIRALPNGTFFTYETPDNPRVWLKTGEHRAATWNDGYQGTREICPDVLVWVHDGVDKPNHYSIINPPEEFYTWAPNKSDWNEPFVV